MYSGLMVMTISYEHVWRVLSDLAADLKGRGEEIPPHIISDMRSAMTLINVLKADPSCVECIPRIEIYLNNVESYLMRVAREKFGNEYAERWVNRLKDVAARPREGREAAPRFIPGLPRGERWVRIRTSEDIPQTLVVRVAEGSGLSCKVQEDGYVLVYGTSGKIREFIRKLREHQLSSREC